MNDKRLYKNRTSARQAYLQGEIPPRSFTKARPNVSRETFVRKTKRRPAQQTPTPEEEARYEKYRHL